MLEEELLVSTLEHSLRQFKSAQARLQDRLKRVESEIEKYESEAVGLKSEIAALEESALRTEEALESLFRRSRESKVGIGSSLE